ncbi:MAG: hypothetical protein Q7R73_04905 [bacterium]|nr:hypothetical protein [bacterium]
MQTIRIPQRTTKEIKTFISQAVYEAMHDPDFGHALTESAKKRLKQAFQKKQRAVSSLEIKRK